MISSGNLRLFFSNLREAGYEWQPQTPDRLLSFRKDPSAFRALVKWLGLGLPVGRDELFSDGLHSAVLERLEAEGFAASSQAGASLEDLNKSSMAVSGSGDVYVVHDHWPPNAADVGGYVHYAAESAWLGRRIADDLEGFIGKRVLDLGCASGALALEVAGVAEEVLGLDISERAVAWARVLAAALGVKSVRYECAAVGDSAADLAVGAKAYDMAIMNPPMVVPALDAAYPHRDGGKLGIETPLLFLEFAARHLVAGGEVVSFFTNPIVKGRPALFDALDVKTWEFFEKRCLHSHFNQEVARKQGYAEQGIERIELWFLHLKKRAL